MRDRTGGKADYKDKVVLGVRFDGKCAHEHTVCAECIVSWSWDWQLWIPEQIFDRLDSHGADWTDAGLADCWVNYRQRDDDGRSARIIPVHRMLRAS